MKFSFVIHIVSFVVSTYCSVVMLLPCIWFHFTLLHIVVFEASPWICCHCFISSCQINIMCFSAVIVVLQYYIVLCLFFLCLSPALSYCALSFLSSSVCTAVTKRPWINCHFRPADCCLLTPPPPILAKFLLQQNLEQQLPVPNGPLSPLPKTTFPFSLFRERHLLGIWGGWGRMFQNNLMKIVLVYRGWVARRTDNVFIVVGNWFWPILE